jgi:hypothetical protein
LSGGDPEYFSSNQRTVLVIQSFGGVGMKFKSLLAYATSIMNGLRLKYGEKVVFKDFRFSSPEEIAIIKDKTNNQFEILPPTATSLIVFDNNSSRHNEVRSVS